MFLKKRVGNLPGNATFVSSIKMQKNPIRKDIIKAKRFPLQKSKISFFDQNRITENSVVKYVSRQERSNFIGIRYQHLWVAPLKN